MKISIKTVAEEAGVSASTASLVLGGRGDALRISKATQDHVYRTAQLLGFERRSAKQVLAVFWCTEFADDLMGRFFSGLQQVLAIVEGDYELLIQLFDYDKLSECQQLLTGSEFSGAIISGATDHDIAFLNDLKMDKPIVLINRNDENYHFVVINNYDIGESVARLFHSHQHEKVGLISMEKKSHAAHMRQMGFLDGCQRHHIQVEKIWVDELGGRDYGTGYRAAKAILKQASRPDALFIMSYGQVLGAMQAIKEIGLKVPKDIEIISFGDAPTFAHCAPTISAVFIPVETLAKQAMQALMLVVEKRMDIPINQMLFGEYVFRESCGDFL